MKNLVVYKANEVIEAGYKLTLNEHRVLLACIAQVNSAEELLETDEFMLSAKDFAIAFGVSHNDAYNALTNVADNLFNRYIVVDNPKNRRSAKKLKTRWISEIAYHPDDGWITLKFAPYILPYLGGLKHAFTKYKLEHVGRMTSIYAIRLYELLAQWQSVGKREVEIAWLKQQFEIEGKYPDMADFKKRVLLPAVEDINEFSNFSVSWKQRMTNRRVTHLIFIFSEKLSGEPKRTVKTKEKLICGVKESEIIKNARPGESYEQAATRIKKAKEIAKIK